MKISSGNGLWYWERNGPLYFSRLYEFFRDVCTECFRRHSLKIGGLGKVVEIDKMLLTRRKYNRDRVIEKQWCFGSIDWRVKKCFVVPVDAAILLPLARQYVPGITIMSDQWAAYVTIKDMLERYQHETVNHILHFIDPETSVYKNTILSLWQKFKWGHKSRYGTERALLQSYMDEFIWGKMYGTTLCTIFGR